MTRLIRNRYTFALVLLLGCLIPAQCGIIFYPARSINPRGTLSAHVDWPMFVLDCGWFLVCIVPGFVALAIDYFTGGMFLPNGQVEKNPEGVLKPSN